VHGQTIGSWLDELASAAPAPGGGAAAALDAAVGAALVSMVCNLTIGKPRYAEYEQTMTEVRAEATTLRESALRLADEDARAFDAVAAAYRLPKETDEQKRARSAAIQQALRGAADVPLRTAALAAEVIGLAGRILDGANVNVLSDVAAAASSARAGLETAILNVEVNLASMTDTGYRDELATQVAKYAAAADEARAVLRAVRERVLR
jgi:formiminotetrahydrofolate cyclodeaminase